MFWRGGGGILKNPHRWRELLREWWWKAHILYFRRQLPIPLRCSSENKAWRMEVSFFLPHSYCDLQSTAEDFLWVCCGLPRLPRRNMWVSVALVIEEPSHKSRFFWSPNSSTLKKTLKSERGSHLFFFRCCHLLLPCKTSDIFSGSRFASWPHISSAIGRGGIPMGQESGGLISGRVEGAKSDKGSCSNGLCQGVHQPSQGKQGWWSSSDMCSFFRAVGGGVELVSDLLIISWEPVWDQVSLLHTWRWNAFKPSHYTQSCRVFFCSKQRASCLSPRINSKSIFCTQWHPESSYGLLLICLCVLLTTLTAPVIRCHRGVFRVWLQDFLEPWRESKSQSVV